MARLKVPFSFQKRPTGHSLTGDYKVHQGLVNWVNNLVIKRVSLGNYSLSNGRSLVTITLAYSICCSSKILQCWSPLLTIYLKACTNFPSGNYVHDFMDIHLQFIHCLCLLIKILSSLSRNKKPSFMYKSIRITIRLWEVDY